MKVEDMKGGYTTGSCATAGMKAGLLEEKYLIIS